MAYPITKLWLYPLCRILIKKAKGIENIPESPNFILISNHERLIDPLLIIYAILRKLNKKVHFIAMPTWWFLGETICRKWAACIPLFNPNQAYNDAKNLVRNGEIVGIFPQGNLKAKIRYPRTGAARLAIETKIPILPIGIKSSYIPFSSTINIGKPIYLKKNLKKGKDVKKQTLDLMKHIDNLTRI